MEEECEFRVIEDGKILCQNKMMFENHDWDCENCIKIGRDDLNGKTR